jgi:hypothetical protein
MVMTRGKARARGLEHDDRPLDAALVLSAGPGEAVGGPHPAVQRRGLEKRPTSAQMRRVRTFPL